MAVNGAKNQVVLDRRPGRAGAAREGGPLLDLLNCPILFPGFSKTLENGFGVQISKTKNG